MPQIFKSALPVLNLQHQGKTSWYRIENKASAPAQVWIYDEIGMFGCSAGQFVSEMSNVTGPVEVHLSTPGGEVFDGIAIYNCLKNRTGVTVVVDSIAASIGSVIAMGADPGQLFMEPSAKMMIHDGFAMAAGNAAELGKMVEQLNSASDTIAGIYSARTGKPAADWRASMMEETWFTADEAVAAGLADGIRSGTVNKLTNKAAGDPPPASEAELGAFLLAILQAAAGPSGKPRIAKAARKDVSAPPGQSQEDDTHFPDGTKKPFPGAKPPIVKKKKGKKSKTSAKSQFPILDADVDNSAWDASKAWKAGAASDDPAKFYAGICAGRKSGDPSVQGAWALPFKYSPSSPPNAAGVRNALARLPQTQGLTNAGQAKATLEKAMKAVSPDYEPDDKFDMAMLSDAFAIGLEGATR